MFFDMFFMYRFSRTLQSLSKLIVALYDACYMFYSMSKTAFNYNSKIQKHF